jgi:hypothetical protein
VDYDGFQSTPLREGRQLNPIMTTFFYSFNPRPCVRGDTRQDKEKKNDRKKRNARPKKRA